MEALIQVFRMTEISEKVRANIIVQLGLTINYKYASNVTEALVYELVSALNPEHEILRNQHYIDSYKKANL